MNTPHARLVQQMVQRERKRFAVMSLQLPSGEQISAPRVIKLAWKITDGDVERLLAYWQHQSALKRWRQSTEDLLNLRSMLQKRSLARTKQPASADTLALTVWNLEQRAMEHMRQHPPVLVAGSWHTPPMLITAADLLPMSMAEMRVVMKRSAKKLREFCSREIASDVHDFRETMARTFV